MTSAELKLWYQALVLCRVDIVEASGGEDVEAYRFFLEWQEELAGHIGECMR